jgi:hypothetical protein
LFDAIEIGKPTKLEIQGTQLLSQADWEKDPRKDVLLPHDTVSDQKTFYSHTPLALRYKNLEGKKQMELEYGHAKQTGNPVEVAAV